jgi:GntR family transcriptional repressor for pyruvate dehydrogenase complex
MLLHAITFDELWGAIHLLELDMARLAVLQPKAELIEKLTRNIQDTQERLSRGKSLVQLEIEFHGLIAQMHANRDLNLARDPISWFFHPTFQRVMVKVPVAGHRLIRAHKAILDSITNGDGAAAEIWMRKYIVDFRRVLEIAILNVNSTVD